MRNQNKAMSVDGNLINRSAFSCRLFILNVYQYFFFKQINLIKQHSIFKKKYIAFEILFFTF